MNEKPAVAGPRSAIFVPSTVRGGSDYRAHVRASKTAQPSPVLDTRYLERCQAAGVVLNAGGCVVMPGYINTHVHTFEHLSRGLIPDDLSTFDWAVHYARPFMRV